MNDNTIKTLDYVLDCCSHRLKFYIETNDKKYMTDCELYMRVANIYMKEIIGAQTCKN